MKRFAGYLAKWTGFTALWLLFVYQITAPELACGAGAAAITLIALESALRAEPFQFRPKLSWLAQFWRMPAMIAEDLWALLKNLGRHLLRKPHVAQFQVTPFHTSGDASRQSAQRCLGVVFMSLPPNSVVVDIDTENNLMMFHQVEPAPLPKILRKLEE